MTLRVEAAFASAARAAADAIALPEVVAGWERASALAGMTVGGVAGHFGAGLDRFAQLLAEPEPPAGPEVDLAAFYGANRIEGDALASDDALHAFIRDDAARRAEAGPVAVLAAFREQAERLSAAVPTIPGDRWVATARVPGGRTRFSTYLPTRVVELAVHTDDLLVSVGIDRPPAPEVADVVLTVALELARARHGDLATLRAAFRGERAAPVFPVL